MKIILLLILATFSMVVFAQNSSTGKSIKPYITPAGEPFGNIATAKMGEKGGSIKSDDGNLEVIFPVGALDTETTISIQSTHNELNENDEGAYKLEPSGIQFKKPVQLIFHYAEANENAVLKSIAWQDDKGQWRRLQNITIDTIQKIVSCFAPHFSNWASFNNLFLKPVSASLKVDKTLKLSIYKFVNGDEDGDLLAPPPSSSAGDKDGDLLAPPSSAASSFGDNDGDLLTPPPVRKPYYTSDWTVNDIVNGNDEVGTVARQNNSSSIYKAPSTVPDNNPVAVSVKVYSNSRTRKLLLTSRINIIGDQYHFTFIHIDENGCYFLVDSSSCILNLKKHDVTISNIKNYPPWSDWPASCDGCRWEWTNKESLKGLVEIAGISASQVTPPNNAGGLPNVNIIFSPATGNTPSAKVTCPRSSPIVVPGKPFPASPREINFDIDGNDVIIHAAGKTGRNELVIQGDKQKTMIYIYKL